MFFRFPVPCPRAPRPSRGLSVFVAALALTLLTVDPSRVVAGSSTETTGPSTSVSINTPMAPPAWAVLERELLRANSIACREFFQKYFDDRGYLKCVERWGGDDGPDDAIENLSDWPILHALGASDSVLEMYKKGWEGHLRQYTQAKTRQVPFARGGMYYKEFPVMFDWLHNGEGLTPFDLQGLADPNDARFQARVRRFAGFYVGEDPEAPNYDAAHKIIRSMFNGSRGPLLRKATAVDWAGDPIEVGDRFKPLHGEHNYTQMLAHFEKYNDIVGDNPMNLEATSLAFNAYALAQDPKYKNWLLEYVDAWVDRTRANRNIIPSNVGLDGVIGSGAGGKWYGGVYGWGFTVRDPATGKMANRNNHHLALTGFGNALLLTGNFKYVDVWRKLINAVNANGRKIDGQMMYPTMYGDDGWYAFTPRKYSHGALNVWYWSMDPRDRQRLGDNGWLNFLDGKDPDYAERTFAQEFLTIRGHIVGLRADRTTPQTRLADDPLAYNPATVYALVNLMLGGLYPGHVGSPLHCRVRYFDPEKRRAGVPDDIAAIVDRLTDTQTGITLVNLNPVAGHSVVVQGGAYAEHQFADVTVNGRKQTIDAPSFTVELAPGSGVHLVLSTHRYVNPPSLKFPWDQTRHGTVVATSHSK
jgi:hypothetical protein